MIRVQRQDFDVGAELAALRRGRTDIGAMVAFTGLVREMTGAGAIREMMLEHYPGMTERQLEKTEADARARWPLQDVLILHRYGCLSPGDQIVLVITASAHREAAFYSCAFLMDYLKSNAPFWKKETGDQTRWVAPADKDRAAPDKWR